ncbi:MAG TPA: alanine racemase [Elusimicrobiota bacterium]|nr:alanine racemase [Elusimicrobiota bacterium]
MRRPSRGAPAALPALPSYAAGSLRPTWAEIDLNAFRHNLKALARFLPRRVSIMAVLKADGYGHGALPLARAAARLGKKVRLWGFGVSSVEEGLALRAGGLRERILVLGSLYPFESLDVALAGRLTPTIGSRGAAQALASRARRLGRPAECHVKIDTGMGRIGMAPATAREALGLFQANPFLRVEGVYTHLACADSAPETAQQLRAFEEALGGLSTRPPWVHAANSAGALGRPAARYDLVRPGIALFGVPPSPSLGKILSLRPVLSWKTRVVFVKMIPKGTPVSYGWTWRAPRRSRIATLPVGYADGYPRVLSNRGEVLLRGRRCPVVGRVTMDQILVDVTGLRGVDVGEEVVLIGQQGGQKITAEDLALAAGTIPYEILCGISKRVPRHHRASA